MKPERAARSGEPGAPVVDVPEHAAVRRPQLPEAERGQPGEELGANGVSDSAQKGDKGEISLCVHRHSWSGSLMIMVRWSDKAT